MLSLVPSSRNTVAKAARRVVGNPLSRRRYSSTVSPTASDVQNCDIVIVGGGPAGLAFANALASHRPIRESLRIALIEAGDLERVRQWSLPEDSFSNRVSSLTNASKKFISDTGAWKLVDESRVTCIEEMQVWDGISDARVTFNASDSGIQSEGGYPPHMSTMTENLNLQRALLRSLKSTGHVELIDNTKVSHIEKDVSKGGWPLVHLSNGATLRARLLVGADGPNSPVRKFAGIESYGWAYDTRAIVATLQHAPRLPGIQPANTIAYQRFLPTGPIAFLPLSPTVSSLVWSTKPALASALISVDPQVLAQMINAAFRLPEVSMRYLHNIILENPDNVTPKFIQEEIQWREKSHDIDRYSAYSSQSANMAGIPPNDSELLPPFVTQIQSGSIASFPLRLTHADTYIGETERSGRTALLGDAAHTTHPLAGQGLNMGLGDAEALANTINNAILLGGDIGSRTALLPYPRARYLENHKLLTVVDKLHKLYGTTLPPIVWARSVGLEVVNELDTLKAAIMMSAGSDVGSLKQKLEQVDVSPWAAAAQGARIADGLLDTLKQAEKSLGGVISTNLRATLNSLARR